MTELLEVARITTAPASRKRGEIALLRYKAFLDDVKATVPNNKWVHLAPVQLCTVHGVNSNLVSVMVKNKILERQYQGKVSMYKATGNLLSVTPRQLMTMANNYTNGPRLKKESKSEPKEKEVAAYTTSASEQVILPTTKVLLSIACYDGSRKSEIFEQTKVDEEALAQMATKILHEQSMASEVTISMVLLTAKRNIVIEK